jgi:hypothetical protein
VIVNNLHIIGVALFPTEADPPLIVDTDAVLTASIAAKPFQSIPGKAKITQAGCRIELLQSPKSLLGKASERFRKA